VVVGIVGDVRQVGLAEAPPPAVYFPQLIAPRLLATLVVRTAGDPMALAAPIRGVIRDIDPNQPIRNMLPLRTRSWPSRSRRSASSPCSSPSSAARARPRRHRHLRRARLLGPPAHAGDRRAHGPRRPRRGRAPHGGRGGMLLVGIGVVIGTVAASR
jgi:hypothetical protein